MEYDSMKWTSLHYACRSGWLELVQSLVSQKCDLNVKTLVGDTPLLLAARYEHRDVVKFLITSGADLDCCNRDKWTVLHYAARNGWLEEVQSLVTIKSDLNVITLEGDTPLLLAARYKNRDVVKFLITSGADLDCCNRDKWTLLHYISRNGWLEEVQYLVPIKSYLNVITLEGDTPLLLAARYENRDVVKFLITSGADLDCCNKDKWTVLHYAACSGWLEEVQSLVNIKSDLNVKTLIGDTPLLLAAIYENRDVVKFLITSGADLDCCNSDEWTVLHYAACSGWLEEVQSLVNIISDLNVKTLVGDTPLLLAARFENRDVVKFLITSGADFDCCNRDKWTVLHYAANNGWLEEVQNLVNIKSDLNVKTLEGDTPLLLAAECENRDVVKFLITSGADLDCYNRDKWTVLHYAAYNGWLEEVQSLVNIKSNLNVKTLEGDTPLFLAAQRCHICIVEFLIKSGADDMKALNFMVSKFFLKDRILKNRELCSQAIINKFNNKDLPSFYKLPGCAERLPSIEMLKITYSKNVTHSIQKSVECDIQTKGYCNLREVNRMPLQLLSVKTLISYYQSKTVKSN